MVLIFVLIRNLEKQKLDNLKAHYNIYHRSIADCAGAMYIQSARLMLEYILLCDEDIVRQEFALTNKLYPPPVICWLVK